MLRYTGHPILDVGVATITAFSRKQAPDQITESDLNAIADYIEANYYIPPLRGFLTAVFMNSGYTQYAYFDDPEKQAIYSQNVLRSFSATIPTTDETGVFLGLPTPDVTYDVKGTLVPGRAFRQHIPLLSGEKYINFFPGGDPGLPVSGLALLAFQAYPLGSAKCQGRTLLVHSDNPDIILHFATSFLESNRTAIQLAQLEGSKKLEEPHLKYRSLVIENLLAAREMQREGELFDEPFSITVYHLTNSGQGKGADLDIYHLPSPIILFLKQMLGAQYSSAWRQIVRQGWELPKIERGQMEAPTDFRPQRNWLYEDLFQLGDDISRSPRFIRTYFLRQPLQYAKREKTDPRGMYSTRKQVYLVSWKLLEPFLRRIVYMDEERIRHIRELGDALADYVQSENDRRFFRAFYTETRYDFLRNSLIKATLSHVRHGNPPLITLDRYLGVFEEGEELARVDWRLARDLVLIRLIEQLYANGWLDVDEDAILDEADNEEA